MPKTVRDVMTLEVTTLGRNDTLLSATDIMNQDHIRHFPVVDEGEVVGVVSQRDLYKASLGTVMKYGEKAERTFLESVAVKEIMVDPITVAPDADVRAAARLMIEHKIGCLPVVEGTALIGIVTETDLLRLVAEQA